MLKEKLREYVKQVSINYQVEHPRYKKALKEFDFKLDNKTFNKLKDSLLLHQGGLKSSVMEDKAGLERYTVAVNNFETLLGDGKELQLLDYLDTKYNLGSVKDLYFYLNSYNYNYNLKLERLNELNKITNDSSKIDCNLHFLDKQKIINLLTSIYNTMLENNTITALKVKESIEKLDKVLKYKKDIIDCSISIL